MYSLARHNRRAQSQAARFMSPRVSFAPYFAWLAVVIMAFALYVSLLPFRLQAVPLDAAWNDFRLAMSSWPQRVPQVNLLANILLFVPVGIRTLRSVASRPRASTHAAGVARRLLARASLRA